MAEPAGSADEGDGRQIEAELALALHAHAAEETAFDALMAAKPPH